MCKLGGFSLRQSHMLKLCRVLKLCLETVNEIIKFVKTKLSMMQTFKG